MIKADTIESAANEIMARAAIDIPEDYQSGIRSMIDIEKGDLSAFVLEAMLENWQVASDDRRPMCGDTGVPRYYIKAGNEAQIEGGFVELENRIRRATAQATRVHGRPALAGRTNRPSRTAEASIAANEIHQNARLASS